MEQSCFLRLYSPIGISVYDSIEHVMTYTTEGSRAEQSSIPPRLYNQLERLMIKCRPSSLYINQAAFDRVEQSG